MSSSLTRAAAAIAAGALLIPAAAADAKPGNGKGHAYGHAKNGVPAPHAVPAVPVAATPSIEVAPVPAEVVPPADVTAAAVLEAPALAPAPAPAPVRVKPAPAAAKRAASRKPAKLQTFVLRGAVIAVDAAAGTVEVAVTGGNAFGRRFAGETVVFDAAAAAVEGVETDGVAGITLADVLAGDAVTLQARLARSAQPGGAVIAARKVTDRAVREAAPITPITPTTPVAPLAPVAEPAPVTEVAAPVEE